MNKPNIYYLIIGRLRRLTSKERKSFPNYKYVTISKFEYHDDDKVIKIPKGFLTDGSTGGPDYGCAWLFHDYLYSTHKFANGNECTREEADRIMKRILVNDRMSIYCWLFVFASHMNFLGLFTKAWNSSGNRGPEFLILD